MIEVTIEELQKKFESLPEDLRWAIMAANVDENITEIGKEFNLNVEQMGQLSLETHAVMFGYTHPDKFEESVKASMQLPDEKNKAIVNAVNEKILKNIREQLMALSGVKKETPDQPTDNAESIAMADRKDTEILKSAQIEIMPARNAFGITNAGGPDEINSPSPLLNKERGQGGEVLEKRNDMLSKVENPNLINPVSPTAKGEVNLNSIPMQKLAGTFRLPNTGTSTPTTSAPTTPPKIDPYREIPE